MEKFGLNYRMDNLIRARGIASGKTGSRNEEVGELDSWLVFELFKKRSSWKNPAHGLL
jgi:hypothetical protein